MAFILVSLMHISAKVFNCIKIGQGFAEVSVCKPVESFVGLYMDGPLDDTLFGKTFVEQGGDPEDPHKLDPKKVI